MIDGLIISTKSNNQDKHLAFAAVAVPGESDSDGEKLTSEEIEYAAHTFLMKYRIVDPDHVCQNPGKCKGVATPVESYITPVEQSVKTAYGEDITLPMGTWILGVHVEDNTVWESVKNGERRGLSLTGVRSSSVGKSLNSRKTLIRDLGDKWEAKTVSIVKAPAVPKAKFFAIKNENEDENMTDNPNNNNNDNGNGKDVETEEAVKTFTKLGTAIKSVFAPKEEVNPNMKDFVTKSELENFKTELNSKQDETLKAIKALTPPKKKEKGKSGCKSGLTPEEEKQLAALQKKKAANNDSAGKSEEEETGEETGEEKDGGSAGKSQQINPFVNEEDLALKSLYEEDKRDGFGRRIH